MKFVKMSFSLIFFRVRISLQLVDFLLVLFASMSSGQQCDSSGRACQTPIQNLTVGNPSVTLTVSSTCGVPPAVTPAIYANPDTPSIDRTCSAGMYPKEYLIDTRTDTFGTYTVVNPVLTTYWQSENTLLNGSNTPTMEFVVLNFSVPYLIRTIGVVFITPPPGITTSVDMRPRAMQFMAWNDAYSQWDTWRFYADFCPIRYSMVPAQGPVDPSIGGLQPAVCMQKYFSGDDSTFLKSGDGLQEVAFEPANEYSSSFASNIDVQRRFTTSALRFQFDSPAQTIPKLSYYSIATLAVEYQCACFGHASSCIPGTGQCICQHNTMGAHCEQCLPAFNNRPWMMGVVTDNSSFSACQSCNCSGYAASCHYDPIYGQGVCDNCTNNTSGIKCESCVPYYYVNPNWNTTAPVTVPCVGFASPLQPSVTYNCNDRCIPCNCSIVGSDPNSLFQCNPISGNCSCKMYVQGRSCDTCQNGFWNLDSANPFGCRGCDCEPSGSLNSINFCDHFNGTCICKNFTQGTRCDSCKTGYFNIDINNPLGCSLCDCDVGASLNLVCPAVGGNCLCKNFIAGRTCREPIPSYFGPTLDYLTFEAEFSASVSPLDIVERYGAGDVNATNTGRGFVSLTAQRSLSMTITVPFMSIFTLVVRYESGATWPAVQALLQISNPMAAPNNCGTGTVYQATQSFTADFPSKSAAGAVTMGTPCLQANIPYTFMLTFPSSVPPNVPILIDSVVLFPSLSTSSAYLLANSSVQAQMLQCSIIQQSVGISSDQSLNCAQFGYSIMVDKFGQAVACGCNSMGSLSTVCSAIGGQCLCKPNVFLRDCSQCKVNSYGFNNGFGCTACNCNPTGSLKSACNDSGICSCRPNVIGNKCDVCIPQYWGVFTGNGCLPCQCNAIFALNNSCMDSGQCYCLPGVGGISCDRCADGYYQLTTSGCTWCGCSLYGSQTINCVPPDGHCVCKARTVGFACDRCQDGYFGLGPWGNDGCIPCFCSGHSNNCSSSSIAWYQVTVNTSLDLFNGEVIRTNEFTAEDQNGNPIPVTTPTLLTQTGEAVRLMTIQTSLNGTLSYFVAPAAYLGDKRSAYGQNLTLKVIISIPPSLNVTPIPVSASGDVFITGYYTSYTLVASYPILPLPNTVAPYSFRLHESVWYLNSSTSLNRVQATYQQMVQVLASVKSIKVRATIYQPLQVIGNASNTTFFNSSLISASLTFANSSAAASGILVNNVEQCICPDGYLGQFCELCALGYTRLNPADGIFSPCIKCFCNNHDAPGTACDPATGACVCINNTKGIQCDQCIDGYYGYPTSGRAGACQPCMCPGNVPLGAINAFSATCLNDGQGGFICNNCTRGAAGNRCDTCSYGYFGTPNNTLNNNGQCQDCSNSAYCNGNAGYNQSCNSTTGECVNCTFNTMGRWCETCQTNYKGNGALRSCSPCNCNSSIGMTGDCDKASGVCTCKPNVVFPGSCTICAFNYFNYSSGNGCQPCNCSSYGSFPSSTCDSSTGLCVCQPGYTGAKCDSCTPGNYLVNGYCYACGCNMYDGSTNNNSVCDPFTGQCPCNPGFTGRVCNLCEVGKNASLPYIRNWSIGAYPNCTACGMCYDNLAGMISQLGINMNMSYRQIMNLWASSYQNANYDYVLSQVTAAAAVVNSSYIAMNQTQGYFPVLQDLQSSFNLIASNISDFTLRTSTNNLYLLIFREAVQNQMQWTGLVQVAPSVYKLPSDISQLLFTIKFDQDSKFNRSVSLYQDIANRIGIMSNVNGTITALRARVTAALVFVGASVTARNLAQRFLNLTSTLPNDLQLLYLTNQINDLTSLLAAGQRHVSDATYFQNLANGALVQMSNVSLMSDVLIFNRTRDAQSLLINATFAQTAANGSMALINSFANSSLAAKQSISGNVISLANALRTLVNGSSTLASGSQTINNILSTSLDALTQLINSLTQQISSLVIPLDRVASINSMAAQSLQLATAAQLTTQAAVAKVQTALGFLNFTQNNLTNAQNAQISAQSKMADATGIMNFITSTILTKTDTCNFMNIVTQKAAGANDLATRTNNNITTDLLAISNIQQNFPLLTSRIRTAQSVGQLVNQTAAGLTAIVANSYNASNNLQTGISTKSLIIAQQKITLQSIILQLQALQQALSDLSVAYNLPGLQQVATQQVQDISLLNSDLSFLQVQLTQVGSQLDALPVNSTYCTLSPAPVG